MLTSLEIKLAGKQFKLLRKTLRGGSLCIYRIDFFSTVCIWVIAKMTKYDYFEETILKNVRKYLEEHTHLIFTCY